MKKDMSYTLDEMQDFFLQTANYRHLKDLTEHQIVQMFEMIYQYCLMNTEDHVMLKIDYFYKKRKKKKIAPLKKTKLAFFLLNISGTNTRNYLFKLQDSMHLRRGLFRFILLYSGKQLSLNGNEAFKQMLMHMDEYVGSLLFKQGEKTSFEPVCAKEKNLKLKNKLYK